MQSHQRTSAKGQGLAEYALVLVLVAVVVIIMLALTGKKIGDVYCTVVIKLAGSAPSNVKACTAPRVSLVGLSEGATIGNNINVEAIVEDDKGLGTNITSVEFFIDGTSKHTEYQYKYCLGGNDTSCDNYNTTSLGSGSHTLRVVATDADNNKGEATLNFRK